MMDAEATAKNKAIASIDQGHATVLEWATCNQAALEAMLAVTDAYVIAGNWKVFDAFDDGQKAVLVSILAMALIELKASILLREDEDTTSEPPT